MGAASARRLFDELASDEDLTVSFAKTISESDVYQFAGITSDFYPDHVNAAYMQTTPLW